MAAIDGLRFDLNPVQQIQPDHRSATWPVYDRFRQALCYSQVLNNDDLAALKSNEDALQECLGLARSRHVFRLDAERSAVIFGEDRDHLLTLIKKINPRRLSSQRVKSYIAQMCAICVDLHNRGFVLQGVLQLSSFALDESGRVFLLSTSGVRPVSRWMRSRMTSNPLYLAPEFLPPSSRSTTNLNLCDIFAADAYSVGMAGLILATGRPPFTLAYKKSFKVQDWLNLTAKLVPEIPNDLDKDLRCLLIHLLERSPEKRMRLHDALHHPALHSFFPHIRRSPTAATATLVSLAQTDDMPASPDDSVRSPASSTQDCDSDFGNDSSCPGDEWEHSL